MGANPTIPLLTRRPTTNSPTRSPRRTHQPWNLRLTRLLLFPRPSQTQARKVLLLSRTNSLIETETTRHDSRKPNTSARRTFFFHAPGANYFIFLPIGLISRSVPPFFSQ